MELAIFTGLAVFGFSIYVIFKQVQFYIQAVNLYKEMVARQDVMIKLLKDMRGRLKGDLTPENKLAGSEGYLVSDLESEKDIESKLQDTWKMGTSSRKNIEEDIRSGDLSVDGLKIKYDVDQSTLNLICQSMLLRFAITDQQSARFIREVDEFGV